MNLFIELLEKIQNINFYYVDTDSLFIERKKQWDEINKGSYGGDKLGQWKMITEMEE